MISVCMATYNGAAFIKRQLDSILNQSQQVDEIIIVDDQSSDQTIELIKDYSQPFIQLVINEVNLGPIKSFEKAISLAQGDTIFLADQDDIWLNHKVASVMQTFANTDAQLVIHDAKVVDGELKILNQSWNAENSNRFTGNLLMTFIKNGYTGCMMAFKKEIKPLALPFPNSIEMHDQWIAMIAIMENKKISVNPDQLMVYVRHGNNVTAIHRRSIQEKLRGRVRMCRAIMSYKRKRNGAINK